MQLEIIPQALVLRGVWRAVFGVSLAMLTTTPPAACHNTHSIVGLCARQNATTRTCPPPIAIKCLSHHLSWPRADAHVAHIHNDSHHITSLPPSTSATDRHPVWQAAGRGPAVEVTAPIRTVGGSPRRRVRCWPLTAAVVGHWVLLAPAFGYSCSWCCWALHRCCWLLLVLVLLLSELLLLHAVAGLTVCDWALVCLFVCCWPAASVGHHRLWLATQQSLFAKPLRLPSRCS
jgi:hypothetical protein